MKKPTSSLLLQTKGFHTSRLAPKLAQKADSSAQEVLVVLGSLGSGKTTLLTDLADYLTRIGKPFKIIVNDIGTVNTDAERLAAYQPTQLTQGCICCSDLESLKQALEELQATREMILIEPTGISDGRGIKQLINQMGMQSRVLTLVNAVAYPQQSHGIQQAITTQAQLADVLAFTHLGSAEHNQKIKSEFWSRFPNTPIIDAPFFAGKENLDKSQDIQLSALLDQLRKPKKSTQQLQYAQQINAHQQVHTFNQEIPESFSYQHLKYLVNAIGEQDLLRMKGIIRIGSQLLPFDYVKGRKEIEFWSATSESPKMTVITETPLSPDLQAMIQTPTSLPQNEKISFTPEQKIFSAIEVAQKVQILLQQYADYMSMDKEKAQLSTQYQQNPSPDLASRIDELTLKLNQLSDAMKFDNPLIWLGYKRTAYQGTPKQVETIDDLLHHCEKKTDICYQRLGFLNLHLKSQFGIDLFAMGKEEKSQTLTDFLKTNHAIQSLCKDEQFMTERLEHEYFEIEWKSAKWKSYRAEG